MQMKRSQKQHYSKRVFLIVLLLSIGSVTLQADPDSKREGDDVGIVFIEEHDEGGVF